MTPSEHCPEEQSEFSLIELLTVLVLHRRLIVCCFVVFAALGVTYAYAIKARSFTATATVITSKDAEAGIAPETVASLAQSEAIRQPLMKQLEKDGFITEADINNDLDGIYTASLNSKTSQVQLSLKLDNAEAAQKNINETAQRIIAEAKKMQLSTVSQRISKLDMARTDVMTAIAAIPAPTSNTEIDKGELLAYALPIAALESSIILQGGERQLIQKMQESAVSLLQDSKIKAVNDRQKKDLFIHTYKMLVKENIEKELQALKQQEQSLVITMPAPLPKKADKPGRALISLLFMMTGLMIGCGIAFIRAAIDKSQHNPATKAQWQHLKNALRR